MRYTITLDLGELPAGLRAVVRSALSEYADCEPPVKVSTYGDVLDVTSRSEDNVREACRVALAKVGKTIDDVAIDLFA